MAVSLKWLVFKLVATVIHHLRVTTLFWNGGHKLGISQRALSEVCGSYLWDMSCYRTNCFFKRLSYEAIIFLTSCVLNTLPYFKPSVFLKWTSLSWQTRSKRIENKRRSSLRQIDLINTTTTCRRKIRAFSTVLPVVPCYQNSSQKYLIFAKQYHSIAPLGGL